MVTISLVVVMLSWRVDGVFGGNTKIELLPSLHMVSEHLVDVYHDRLIALYPNTTASTQLNVYNRTLLIYANAHSYI